jgi:RNA polymerase sigma-70 factor (sigma-E family)
MPDRSDFDEFVVTRSSRLLRTAYLLTRDWALAEDLLQTALAKSWFAWGRVSGDPEPFVRKVLVNTYASWWRRRWRGETPTESMPESTGPDATSQVDDRDQLWQAIGRLPRRQQAVLVLRYFEDLGEAQVADTLGISTGTVKSQTSKALARLRLDPDLQRSDHDGQPILNGGH